jgi:D-xylonolactonase
MTTPTPVFETLASGYGLVEGPRVDSKDRLYFSDAMRGGVYRRDPDGRIETIVPKRRGVGGIALHAAGGIVISGRNICHVREGESRVLFDLEDAPGFNDLIADSEGRILVGSQRFDPFAEKPTPMPGELYRIDARGKAETVYGDVGLTNGLGFSPDGARLYHSDSTGGHVITCDLGDDGSWQHRRIFAEMPEGAPDGLAVDEAGCVWVAAFRAGCVTRFAPDGSVDLQLEVPASAVASVCFGGSDRRDLYIATADNRDEPAREGTLFRTRVDVPGLLVAEARA